MTASEHILMPGFKSFLNGFTSHFRPILLTLLSSHRMKLQVSEFQVHRFNKALGSVFQTLFIPYKIWKKFAFEVVMHAFEVVMQLYLAHFVPNQLPVKNSGK